MASPKEETLTEWIQGNQIPAALILYLYRTTEKRFTRELASYDMEWEDFAILMAVYQLDGRSQDNLAHSRGFDKTMVTKAVLRLEERGLVRWSMDPVDKNTKRLFVTEKGKSVQPDMGRIGSSVTASLLQDLGPEGSSQSLEVLRKISLNASKM